MLALNMRSHRNCGLSLIELMLTLTILGALALASAPHLAAFQRNAALTSATNQLVAALHTARSEGMKRNLPTMLTPRNAGQDWSQGWQVFVDTNFNGIYDSADILIRQQPAPPAYLRIAGNGTSAANPSYILYDGSGYPKTKNGGFSACTLQIQRTDDDRLQHTRRIKLASSGRLRVCTPKSATDANCTGLGSHE